MATDRNEHDLPRYIEADKRRYLRQEAGFGCVKCGYAFCEYEHIDPEFKDAKEHDVTKMAYLCKRCHGDVTAGRASKESVWKAKAAPFCIRSGKPGCGMLEFGSLNSAVGSLMFFECRVILKILGDELLTIEAPDQEGGPIRVNAKLYDGPNLSLQIEDNGILISDENWDVEVTGDVLTVRRGLSEPSLIYRFLPKSGIRIERLNMRYRGVDVVVDADHVRVGNNDFRIDAVKVMFQDCVTCIDVRGNGICLGDLPDPLPSKPVEGSIGGLPSRLPIGSVQPSVVLKSVALRTGWLQGNVQIAGCSIDDGLYVTSGSRVMLGSCCAKGGIFLENGATLSVVAGAIAGR
jgi:hypothetical protein